MPSKKTKHKDASGPGQGATKADILEGARTLYVEGGWTLAKIAEALVVHPNTLTRWSKDGQWEEIKAARVGGRHEIERRMLRQTLRLIELIDREQDGIPTLAQSNTLLNYKKFMEGLKPELTLTILVEAGVSFTNWAAQNYPEQSQMLFKLWDEFISTYIAKAK